MDEPIIVAGLLNSALYLAGVVAAGLVWGNHLAVVLALATLGVTTLCYAAQLAGAKADAWAFYLWLVSNALGIAAGLQLLRSAI